nr:protein kinase [uncultured Methanospirillum sp.]
MSDTFPKQIGIGGHKQHSITFSNTGMVAWEHKVETFGVACSIDRPGVRVDPMFASIPQNNKVMPGKAYEFVFSIIGDTPGNYVLTFTPSRMSQDNPVSIGDSHIIHIEIIQGEIGTDKDSTGSLQIVTGDQPLHVTIDGAENGDTPIQVSGLMPGSHAVHLSGEEFDQVLQTFIKPHEVTILSVDPTARKVCLSAAFMPSSSETNPLESLLVSNFIVVLGVFLGLTLTGAYATLIISKKVKKSKNRLENAYVCPSALSENCRDVRIETRRNRIKKDDLVFDPLMMICDENSSGEVRIKATNWGSRPVNIEGTTISDGESKFILVRVPTGDPGDHQYSRELLFLDGAGREFTKYVTIRYKVRPIDPSLEWFFSRFVYGKDRIIAVVRMKNSSSYPVMIGDIEIPPLTEEEIELGMEGPDGELPEVNRTLSVQWGAEKNLNLKILIPFNKGILLRTQKRYDEAIAYYRELLKRDSGSADLWIQHGQVLVDIGKSDEAEQSFLHARSLDPSIEDPNAGVQKLKKEAADTLNSQNQQTTDFPNVLSSLYTPISFIGADNTGKMYLVERVADRSMQMVKILDENFASLPSLRLAIQTWRSLHHPHILRLTGWESEPIPFLEIDPPEGAIQKGLRKYSIASLFTPIPMKAAVLVELGICRGLSYIHKQGARHYLLEPSAIYLDRNLHVRIGGFDNTVTLSNKECSSKCWILAPEQLYPERYGNPGKKTDIYQAGAVLYLLLTGSRPYGRNDPANSVNEIQGPERMSLVLPSQFRQDLGCFDQIIARSLAVDKNERYNSVDEMIDDLEDVRIFLSGISRNTKLSDS